MPNHPQKSKNPNEKTNTTLSTKKNSQGKALTNQKNGNDKSPAKNFETPKPQSQINKSSKRDKKKWEPNRKGVKAKPKTKKQPQDKKNKKEGGKKFDKNAPTGVLYLGRIPYGFFENEVRGFFGQFGTVTRCKISRSPKTRGSRGYGFLKFEDPDVAEIAAKAMNGYLLFEKRLVVKVLSAEQLRGKDLFSTNPINKRSTTLEREKRRRQKGGMTPASLKELRKQKQKQLDEWGITYDLAPFYTFPDLSLLPPSFTQPAALQNEAETGQNDDEDDQETDEQTEQIMEELHQELDGGELEQNEEETPQEEEKPKKENKRTGVDPTPQVLDKKKKPKKDDKRNH